MLASLLALLLHLDTDLRHLARLDLDLPRLLAERLVPDLDRLLARGHVLDLRRAVGVRHAEDRRRRHRDPAEHPAVPSAGGLAEPGLPGFPGLTFLELRLRLVIRRFPGRERVEFVR